VLGNGKPSKRLGRGRRFSWLDRARNGDGKLTEAGVFNALVTNLLPSVSGRPGLNELLIDQSGRRDLDKEFDYPETLDIRVYRQLFKRNGLANKVVRVYPDECAATKPRVYETEKPGETPWEKQVGALVTAQNLWAQLHKLDVLSGLGCYGGLLCGVSDGRPLSKPVAGVNDDGTKGDRRGMRKPRKLLFTVPLAEDQLRVVKVERDTGNPRFGQPKLYAATLDNSVNGNGLSSPVFDPDDFGSDLRKGEEVAVHWSRVVHVADGALSCRWKGTPRLEPVANYVWDARKVIGSAAEMFFKGGFPGLSIQTHPGVTEFLDVDLDQIRDEVDAYQNGLQRFLRLVNMDAKSLAVQVADPSKHLDWLVRLISAVIGVPMSILIGTEGGNPAAGVAVATFNRRLTLRLYDHVAVNVIRPFFDRMMLLDVLPTLDSYFVEWPDLQTQTEKDKADVGMKLTQALLQYVTSGAFYLVRPKAFFTLYLKFTDEEAESMVAAAGGEDAIISKLKEMVKKTAGNTPGTSGTNPTARTGAAGQRNGLARKRKSAVKRVS
jgi:hypothetical protein